MKYYKSEKTGSYYSIENEELIFYPMNKDGSRGKEGGAVDWDFVTYEPTDIELKGKTVSLIEYLKYIERKLK